MQCPIRQARATCDPLRSEQVAHQQISPFVFLKEKEFFEWCYNKKICGGLTWSVPSIPRPS